MAKYGVLITTDKLQLHVVKTTVDSPADSDWSSQDSANSPLYTFGTSFEIMSYWSVEHGGDVYVVTQQRSGRVAFHTYDPGTDTWFIVDDLVAVVGVSGFEFAPAFPAVSMAIKSDGTVVVVAAYNDGNNERLRLFSRGEGSPWAWGKNNIGQLGDFTTVGKSRPVNVASGTNFRSLSAGQNHTLGIGLDGSLWAWGSATDGRLGNLSTSPNISSPIQIGVATDWSEIYAGGIHSAAINDAGELFTWGNNASGQLGHGDTITISSPVQVGILTDWLLVSCANSWTLAVKTDGTLWAWGENSNGRCGLNDITDRSSPTQIGALTTWANITTSDLSGGHAVKINGTLWGWGQGTNGRLGDGTVATKSSPIQIGALEDWNKLASGSLHVLAVKNDGTLWAWGLGDDGRLGDGTTVAKSSPVQIGNRTDWKSVSANRDTSYATTMGGDIWVWGDALDGALGNGTTTPDLSSPVQIGEGIVWDNVVGGLSGFAMALAFHWSDLGTADGNEVGKNYQGVSVVGPAGDDRISWAFGEVVDKVIKQRNVQAANRGDIFSWGLNTNGGIGDDTTDDRSSPVLTGGGSDWAEIQPGGLHVLAKKRNGKLYAWGAATSGALGDLTTTHKSSPVQVLGAGPVRNFSAGGSSFNALVRKDGSLYTWGASILGKLGDGQISVNKSSPVQVGTLKDWDLVSCGNVHAMAIKQDGTLWGWGSAGNGTLGDGTTIAKSSPVQIGALTDWQLVETGNNNTAAIKDDGTLWTWGFSNNGALGNGTTTPSLSSPAQVGSDTDWALVTVGADHMLAIKKNGALWSWGSNGFGQLGHSNTTELSSPVQVGSDTDWVDVHAGTANFTHATRIDGTIWSWGLGTSGQLGHTDLLSRSSPVQIGTLIEWSIAKSGNVRGMALKSEKSPPKLVDAASDTAAILVAPGVIDSADKIYIPFVDADDQLSIASWTSAEDPTIAIDSSLFARTVFGHGRTTPAFAAACLAIDIDDSHGLYYDDAGNDIYHEDDVDGAVGSDTLVQTIPTNVEMWAWGFNGSGQLGQGDTAHRSFPVQIGTLTNWDLTLINNRLSHVLAIKADGSLWAWGLNLDGQIGDGTVTSRSSPVQIGSEIDWTFVSTGWGHSHAIRNGEELWAWGEALDGSLGNGQDTVDESSPIQIGAATDWEFVAGGNRFGVAIRNGGELWSWGAHTNGKLGDGSPSGVTLDPTQVGALTDWAFLDAGANFVISLKKDGTLWAWGQNNSGQLGDGTIADKSSPVQIGADTDWLIISVGTNSTTAAIRQDGTLWTWGSAQDGKLGNGTTTPNISSPAQIGALTDWADVVAGDSHMIALKKDGTLWAWGNSSSGRLGNGEAFNDVSSPIQIGALTDWSFALGGSSIGLASKAITEWRISARVIP